MKKPLTRRAQRLQRMRVTTRNRRGVTLDLSRTFATSDAQRRALVNRKTKTPISLRYQWADPKTLHRMAEARATKDVQAYNRRIRAQARAKRRR